MNITCPRCGFSRSLSPDRLPARTVIATCPHCACRFRFVPETGAVEPLPDARAASPDAVPSRVADAGGRPATTGGDVSGGYEDDPLPPGAVIPGRGLPSPEEGAAPVPEPSVGKSAGEGPAAPAAAGRDAAETEGNASAGEEPFPGRRDADRPQPARAASGEDPGEETGGAAANPWEAAPAPDGWIAAFYHTCVRVMFGAPQFFSRLRPDAPQLRPLLFYLVISVIQVVVERVWAGVFLSLMAPGAASDPELAKMLELLSPQVSLPLVILLKTGVSVAQLYILATLLHFAYGFVVRPRPDFSRIFQIAAYAAAPSLLCIVPLLGSIAGFIWMLACLLVGCRAALRLSWPQTFAGFLPVAALLAPLTLQLLRAAQG
ncbi:MAG: hypothetical protein E7022_09780 [Desulfovibrio desulfuricans]|nr:hypothetical protein [Desulfovibrio desulfuricans]